MKLLTLLCLLFLCFPVAAQNPCPGNGINLTFQANRIGALYSPNGSRFLNGEVEGAFRAPYTSESSPITIFASMPWIGGYAGDELKLAGPNYTWDDQDYYMGPLGADATPYDLCSHFDKVWFISRNDIEQHRMDFEADGVINDTLSSVFGWPAQGNVYFELYNGFVLPDDHQGGWAAFADNNQNGTYDPHLGEYPVALLKGNEVNPEAIGWLVFNDQGPHELSGGQPAGVEMQLTIFGFYCEDNYALNNSLFNSYKIINQSSEVLDSTFFGVWTDYDLGCSTDDFLGSDSARHTEFVYNDVIDGDSGTDCSAGQPTYGNFPPVQSMTYLSHPMHTFIGESRQFAYHMYPSYLGPQDQYTLMNGLWPDGTPIRISGDGFETDSTAPVTRYLFNGDPRDSTQWSWWQEGFMHSDVRAISSVSLGEIRSGDQAYVETVYTFHQDVALDHLEQFGFMYENIDSLLVYVDNIHAHCQQLPVCTTQDCVWPGDFDHNGIADHFDMLYWGVIKEQAGAERNGLINWIGHLAEEWTLTLPTDINAKHGDGNGNGIINDEDIDRNLVHFLYTNPYYEPSAIYPEGPEIVMTASAMSANGLIRNVLVETGIPLHNVLGLAYELDFDTSLYHFDGLNIVHCPVDVNRLCITDNYKPVGIQPFDVPRFMFVRTDHQAMAIDSAFELHRLFNGFKLNDGKTLDDIPDTVIIRLKNLIAIDAEGNDLHIGAHVLRVPKHIVTDTDDPVPVTFEIFPNPASESLTIETVPGIQVTLYSYLGEPLQSIIVEGDVTQMNIKSLPPGVYSIRLNGTLLQKRFVKI